MANDVETMFVSEHCNLTTATVFRNRLVFTVDLATGARKIELCMLNVDRFKREIENGKPNLVY